MLLFNVGIQSSDLGAIVPNFTFRFLGNPHSRFCPDGERYILSGQHGFSATWEICDEYLSKNLEPPKWCTHFNCKIIRLETSL